MPSATPARDSGDAGDNLQLDLSSKYLAGDSVAGFNGAGHEAGWWFLHGRGFFMSPEIRDGAESWAFIMSDETGVVCAGASPA